MLKRREFLRSGLCLGGTIFGGFALAEVAGAMERKRPPNVLLIFTDDQGSIDMNCYGASDLITPNMDALAADGVRFTQFYAGSSICSPSRACLMTGRYPRHAELPGNVPYGSEGMPGEQVTIAEMMKQAGYATGHVGKWHLGHHEDTMPNAQGFDESFGHLGGCIDNYSHFFYWQGPNRHDLYRNGKEVWHEGEYFGDLMVAECNKFIEKNRAKPFFLYWAINMPHYPLQATAKWRKKYSHLSQPRGRYAAFVSTMDEMIGEVINKLEELGLRDDTIIIFQSDHGHSTETRTFGGGGSAGEYRGHKFTLWEGGIRIPAIISWPGRIASRQVRNQIAHSSDWMPTIADYTGASLPDRNIDGRSLAGVIESATAESPHRVLHWTRDHKWAVRFGKWKLVANETGGKYKGTYIPEAKYFLSDMIEDVTETKNLADAHPQVVEKLRKMHEDWLETLD